MSVCIYTNYLDPRCFYPVLDPRRTAGPGPHRYPYGLAYDGIEIRVERLSALANCEMTVELSTSRLGLAAEPKEIQAWNLFSNAWVDRIGSWSLDLPQSMNIRRSWGPGQGCGAGTDTLVLCRHTAWPRGRVAFYCFPPQDFWDFWGGCKVTFDWLSDQRGSGVWGDQTPPPKYPLVKYRDGTVIREEPVEDHESAHYYVYFGGAAFRVSELSHLTGMGLDINSAIHGALVSTPADWTLVREFDRPEVYVTFGGAKFRIPDPQTLYSLGFDWSGVRVIPPGGTSQLRTMPIDGTLLREQAGPPRIGRPHDDVLRPAVDPLEQDPGIYLVAGQQLRRVTDTAAMEGRCLSWRHVRTVPENSLAGLSPGPDLGP